MREEIYGIGSEHVSNYDGVAIVKRKVDTRKREVEFESGGTRLVDVSDLSSGRFRKSSFNSYSVGDEFDSEDYGVVVIVNKLEDNRRLIRFKDTGNTGIYGTYSIKHGKMIDHEAKQRKYDVGTEHVTNHCGIVDVVKVVDNSRRIVVFRDVDKIKMTDVSSLLKGSVSYKYDYRVTEISDRQVDEFIHTMLTEIGGE